MRGKTVIVTGASMGIGAAISVALGQAGATVWAVARNRERLQIVAGRQSRINPIVADISVDSDRARLIEAAGRVDILVNNAGIASAGMIESMPAGTVRHMYELNVIGLIDLTQRVLSGMLKRRNGHICNIGSSVSYFSGPPLSIYASTKYAVEGFSDGLRREVLHRGVGVSLIQPGPVRTGFWDRAIRGDRPDVASVSGNGVPAEWVAKAVVRAIRYDRIPGYRHVAVPRPLGLGRVLDIPGVAAAADFAARFRSKPMDAVMIPYADAMNEDAEVIPINEARTENEAKDQD